jgi:amino acid transporter
MATQTEERGGAQTERRLQRDVSTIGLLFFSLGSIIGSGWLFTPLVATQIAGPAAIIAWVIGGAVMLILALVHAELGGMYPVAGGSARYPHFSFGSMAGFTIGWIVWVGSVTVAPIEVLAVTTYGVHFFPWMMVEQAGTEVLTGPGIVVSVILMAVFTVINLLGVGSMAKSNNVIMIWKIAIPFLAIIVLIAVAFNPSNFTAAEGFGPFGASGILLATFRWPLSGR